MESGLDTLSPASRAGARYSRTITGMSTLSSQAFKAGSIFPSRSMLFRFLNSRLMPCGRERPLMPIALLHNLPAEKYGRLFVARLRFAQEEQVFL